MVRTRLQVDRVIAGVEANPGVVLYTMVNESLRQPLQECCRRLNVPAIPVLDPAIGALGAYLGRTARNLPGQQHTLNHEYFQRIDAMTFAMTHDDGQALWGLEDADVVLVGVSRTSKTPTCIYLANRGIKAANVPFVPNIPLPPELFAATKPLIVGLTNDPERLIAIRRNRMNAVQGSAASTMDYIDIEAVQAEVTAARRLFHERKWPVIDMTRRSIEETAAAILKLVAKREGQRA
jgi:regulator of PEP synthase PpsR (kinase-PPPase family)